MKKKIAILALLLIFIMTSGFGCKTADKKTQEAMKPVTLEFWRVWDGPDAFDEIIAKYKQLHPFVTVNYKKLRYEEYENELLEAFAEDKGPDIFSIHNTWIGKYKSKIVPMPLSTTMAYPVLQGTLKKEIIPELRTTKSITLRELKDNFVDVVFDDVVREAVNEQTKTVTQSVFGLPLSVDTLAVYYNTDIFKSAGIVAPPKYWNAEFQQAVKKMSSQDTKGNIIKSGVAMGGSQNIDRYTDIVSALMMQNGSVMTNDQAQITFHLVPSYLKGDGYNPGFEALRFYTDFSNPSKEVYSWNNNLPNAMDQFTQGKLAMMFGYAYQLPTIKSRAPKLNFGVAKLPQIEGNSQVVNYGNYWVESVSKKSKYQNEAWDFIQFITKADQARLYLEKTKKPTALKVLIQEQVDDMEIGVFAEQVLSAKSWYKGNDFNAIEKIFGEMINNANAGRDKMIEIIKTAAQQAQQTME